MLAVLSFPGCNKSGKTEIKNFFGAPPAVSEVSITKERSDFSGGVCSVAVELCSCCCVADLVSESSASLDLITASAKVVDPTADPNEPPDPNYSDVLVVVLRFLDPPPATVPPGTQINQISLEMFDSGPVAVGQLGPPLSMDIYSGDLAARDGIFTRKFYFGTSTPTNSGTCVEDTDKANLGHTYSTYSTSVTIDPSTSENFQFTVQAVDRKGSTDTSTEIVLPVQGTFRENISGQQRPCGGYIDPADPSKGCLPGP
jgi:hypothetical protein